MEATILKERMVQASILKVGFGSSLAFVYSGKHFNTSNRFLWLLSSIHGYMIKQVFAFFFVFIDGTVKEKKTIEGKCRIGSGNFDVCKS